MSVELWKSYIVLTAHSAARLKCKKNVILGNSHPGKEIYKLFITIVAQPVSNHYKGSDLYWVITYIFKRNRLLVQKPLDYIIT